MILAKLSNTDSVGPDAEAPNTSAVTSTSSNVYVANGVLLPMGNTSICASLMCLPEANDRRRLVAVHLIDSQRHRHGWRRNGRPLSIFSGRTFGPGRTDRAGRQRTNHENASRTIGCDGV